jgi:hypothetical protein
MKYPAGRNNPVTRGFEQEATELTERCKAGPRSGGLKAERRRARLGLPVHRWLRYSAGFSAEWMKWLLAECDGSNLRVLDPSVGS